MQINVFLCVSKVCPLSVYRSLRFQRSKNSQAKLRMEQMVQSFRLRNVVERRQVAGAFACSEMMDDVLTSGAVADLAFAACVKKQVCALLRQCNVSFLSSVVQSQLALNKD